MTHCRRRLWQQSRTKGPFTAAEAGIPFQHRCHLSRRGADALRQAWSYRGPRSQTCLRWEGPPRRGSEEKQPPELYPPNWGQIFIKAHSREGISFRVSRFQSPVCRQTHGTLAGTWRFQLEGNKSFSRWWHCDSSRRHPHYQCRTDAWTPSQKHWLEGGAMALSDRGLNWASLIGCNTKQLWKRLHNYSQTWTWLKMNRQHAFTHEGVGMLVLWIESGWLLQDSSCEWKLAAPKTRCLLRVFLYFHCNHWQFTTQRPRGVVWTKGDMDHWTFHKTRTISIF